MIRQQRLEYISYSWVGEGAGRACKGLQHPCSGYSTFTQAPATTRKAAYSNKGFQGLSKYRYSETKLNNTAIGKLEIAGSNSCAGADSF